MDKIKKLKYYIKSLCIYDLKTDIVISSMYDLLCSVNSDTVLEKQSSFFRLVSERNSLKEYISKCILSNDNVFSKSASAGILPDELIINAVKSDLKKLEEIASLTAYDISDAVKDSEIREILKTIPEWENGKGVSPLTEPWDNCTDKLAEYHKTNGYGIFAKHIAFTWRCGEMVPITSLNSIRLSDLKNYEIQRKRVVDNTESFLMGHPANNVLLYGDRGTGKSSTVHALLNEYHNKGLRMIEIPKSAVSDLGIIREYIADSPMKFIVFIDDLSFDSNDSSFSELKAALEGSLSGRQPNTLIYATSNRRHLIKENFSDRENDVNRGDTMQEQLSLSDRFGLSVTFLNPDRQNYLDIVKKITADRNLEGVDEEKLCFLADRWATRRGGRSPRCAKQFVDYAESCIRKGIDIDFK